MGTHTAGKKKDTTCCPLPNQGRDLAKIKQVVLGMPVLKTSMRSNRIFKFIAENYIAQATSILDETKVDEICKHSSDAKTRNPIRNSIQ